MSGCEMCEIFTSKKGAGNAKMGFNGNCGLVNDTG